MNRKIRTWVEISLNDLEHNYREISSRLPDGCQMLGVCKANAYGHGAVRVAQRLQRAGCQWIAVNCYDEAEELRALAFSDIRGALKLGLEMTVAHLKEQGCEMSPASKRALDFLNQKG